VYNYGTSSSSGLASRSLRNKEAVSVHAIQRRTVMGGELQLMPRCRVTGADHEIYLSRGCGYRDAPSLCVRAVCIVPRNAQNATMRPVS
jgi:hypothetical protein